MDPTGEKDEYPLLGLLACLQTQDDDGTGTQDVAVVLLVVDGALDEAHVQIEVEVVGEVAGDPDGGYLDLQPEGEQ